MSKKKSKNNYASQKRKNIAKNILTGTVIVLSLAAVGTGTGAVIDCARAVSAQQTQTSDVQITSYLIKFHGISNNGAIMAPIEMSAKKPEGKLTKNELSRNGYFFVGWSVTSAPGGDYGTHVDYEDEALLSDIETLGCDRVIDLYAVWQSTLNLDLQGGYGMTSTRAIFGENINITPPTRDGYEYAGHFTGKNGAGVKYIDESGQGVHPNDLPNGTTLYANWVQNSN